MRIFSRFMLAFGIIFIVAGLVMALTAPVLLTFAVFECLVLGGFYFILAFLSDSDADRFDMWEKEREVRMAKADAEFQAMMDRILGKRATGESGNQNPLA